MVFDMSTMVSNRKHDYSWGSYKFKKDPNLVGAIVEGIEAERGKVTSEALLDIAREDDSPIHDMFEWNDTVAAEKYRLSTGAHIINALRVVVKTRDGEEKNVSAFVSVKTVSKKERVDYVNINAALSDEDTRAAVLDRMRRDMKTFVDRYSLYEEAAGVISAINEAISDEQSK